MFQCTQKISPESAFVGVNCRQAVTFEQAQDEPLRKVLRVVDVIPVAAKKRINRRSVRATKPLQGRCAGFCGRLACAQHTRPLGAGKVSKRRRSRREFGIDSSRSFFPLDRAREIRVAART